MTKKNLDKKISISDAKLFFKKNCPSELSNFSIAKCEPILNGSTNNSFKLDLNNKMSFQVRFGDNNDIVSRYNEKQILLAIKNNDFVYYDIETGNAIKKWINGEFPKKFTNKIIDAMVVAIKKINLTDIRGYNIKKFDPFVFFDISPLSIKEKELYVKLVKKYKNLPLVLCHNDLNQGNFIYCDNNTIYIFDYEWGRLNSVYWELANFTRDSLNIKQAKYLLKIYKNLSWKTFYDFLLMTTLYAIQWTYSLKTNSSWVKEYRDKVYKRFKYYCHRKKFIIQ